MRRRVAVVWRRAWTIPTVAGHRGLSPGSKPPATLYTSPPVRPETSALLGQRIGNIRAIDVPGEGGMGAVYVGHDDKLQRKVALKAIRSEYRLHEKGDHDAAEPLYREALAVFGKTLPPDHPHLLRTRERLVSLLHERGRDAEAAELEARAAAARPSREAPSEDGAKHGP